MRGMRHQELGRKISWKAWWHIWSVGKGEKVVIFSEVQCRVSAFQVHWTWMHLVAPDCKLTWLHLNLIAPEPDYTWLHLITPDCTWLHLIAPDWTWWHLITPGSTWLHMVAPDCTWAWLHLIGSSTGFTWLKCTCLLALEQYFLNLTAFDSTSSRVHCIFVCFGSKNSMAQNGICLQL